MLSWKVIIWIVLLNLHGATRSTRPRNKRASSSAWLSFFLQHCDVGQHRSKNDHDEEIKSQIFYWNCYMYCCERQGRKFQALRETKNTWNFLLSSRLQHRVLVHFFQVLLTWLNPLKINTYFCSLQWVEKVTAQMIPSSSPLVKFWHCSLFVTSTVCMYNHGTP